MIHEISLGGVCRPKPEMLYLSEGCTPGSGPSPHLCKDSFPPHHLPGGRSFCGQNATCLLPLSSHCLTSARSPGATAATPNSPAELWAWPRGGHCPPTHTCFLWLPEPVTTKLGQCKTIGMCSLPVVRTRPLKSAPARCRGAVPPPEAAGAAPSCL